MIRYIMVKDLTAKDKADYQKFIDFSVKIGTLGKEVDVTKYLQGVLIPMADGARADAGGSGRRAARHASRRRRAPHVTVRGLTKRFGNGVDLRRFDLDIPRGKLISVFGPNGCGKSTLINIIAGLIPPDAGEILFDGKPLQ